MPLDGLHVTFGRWLPSARYPWDMAIAIGWPLCSVRIVETFHPPRKPSRTRFMSRPIQRPRPTGNSRTAATARRCGGIVGADGVLGAQVVELLRVAVVQETNEGISACRRVVDRFSNRVVALQADVVAGALLEANL